MYVSISLSLYIYTYIWYVYVYTYTHLSLYIYIYICTYIYIYIYMLVEEAAERETLENLPEDPTETCWKRLLRRARNRQTARTST